MFDQVAYQTVILGGLLHDNRKSLQRGDVVSPDTSGKHPEFSSRFVPAFTYCFGRLCLIPSMSSVMSCSLEGGANGCRS